MISVVILSYNNSATIEKAIKSAQEFDEVLLVDSGSTDNTLALASKYPNVRIVSNSPFPGFGKQRRFAEKHAKNPWILALDSDEELSLSLKNSLQRLSLDEKKVYTFPRKTFFQGRWIKHCGWYPDHCKRLYNKNTFQFDLREVHESIPCKKDELLIIPHPILHESYRSIDDFLKKMQSYSSYFASQYKGKRSSSLLKALLRGVYSFLRTYLLKKGFLDGKQGIIISLYQAHTAYYKYLKLAEKNDSI